MENLRPGVYTSYTLLRSDAAASSAVIGIAANAGGTLTKTTVESLEEARTACSGELLELCEAVFAAISARVVLADLAQGDAAALQALIDGGASLWVLESADAERLALLDDTLSQAAKDGKRAVAVVGCASSQEALEASSINSMRIALTCPAVHYQGGERNVAPALVAAFLALSEGEQQSLNGALSPEGFSTEALTEEVLQELLWNGVCAIEPRGGVVSLIRGVSSRTIDEEGIRDGLFRNLASVLTFDEVLDTLETTLKERVLAGVLSTDSVTALLVNELAKLEERGKLSGYETPIVTRLPSDSSVCVVTVSFTLAQCVNQVWLQAVVQG